MSWNDEMIERQRASETNSCRDIVEVPLGSSYKIRKLMEEYPQFLWKYSEGSTVPGYVIKIAEQLEREFYGANSVPIDLYPCEYFRIMEHSLPTELALQPKRFDKAQEQLHEKLQLYYENNESDLLISNEHLIPRIACAVRIQNKWYRGRLENIPVGGIWAYVLLVDVGTSRQVMKNDVRNLPFKFGHYPPMIVKARIRGALIQRMDSDKIDRFRMLIKNLGYLARCQITTSTEPFDINMCHPSYEQLNVCSFLLEPRRGQPSEPGVWLPKKISKDLNRENGIESDENDDSGADSDFNENDEDTWDFEEEADTYLRSFSPATKVFRIANDTFQVEQIENEKLIFLTNNEMREKRREAEEYLEGEKNNFEILPEVWIAFGTACVVFHEGVPKRAVICGDSGSTLSILLLDYGTVVEFEVSEVFSLPNEASLNMEPQVTLVALSEFDYVHYSRVEVLRQILPQGTSVRFERERRSKEIPTKGVLFLPDNTPVSQLALNIITDRGLNLECSDIVPYHDSSDPSPESVSNQTIINFMYDSSKSVIYKKSKFVTSKF